MLTWTSFETLIGTSFVFLDVALIDPLLVFGICVLEHDLVRCSILNIESSYDRLYVNENACELQCEGSLAAKESDFLGTFRLPFSSLRIPS